jgi:hypothetical protein
LKRRRFYTYAIASLAVAVAISFAMPALGAPSPLTLAKRALKIGKSANKRAKKAGSTAKRALALAKKKQAQGPKGATGATGPAGPAGTSALSTVPSGQTLHGAVGGDFHNFDATQSVDFGTDVTLPMKAANNLSDTDVAVNVAGWTNQGGQTAPSSSDSGDAACTGNPANPTAPAGKVCIYVSGADNAQNLAGQSVLAGTGASPYGFKLKWDASGTQGDTFVDATWAYTAP